MPAQRAVEHQPKPPLRDLLRAPLPSAGDVWGPLDLLASGRDALFRAYRVASQGPWSVAWFPSFHCGVEVQAAVASGWDVDFFPVGLDLRVDRQGLRTRLAERPGPVTLIHYFGHPTPDVDFVADLCRRVAVPLIEDACHGPLGVDEGGIYAPRGAAVAFSLRKVLGMPDGGFLRLHPDPGRGMPRPSVGGKSRSGRRWLGPLLSYLRRFVELEGPAERDRPAEDGPGGGTERLEPREGYGGRISRLSERLVHRVDPGNVVDRRRSNWLLLSERLRRVPGFYPVVGDLSEGAVPLSMAVRVARRADLVRSLLRAGVDSYVFGRWHHPGFPASEFPRSLRLRREILGLPVHHGLGGADLDRMVDVLTDLLPDHDVEDDGDEFFPWGRKGGARCAE